MQQDFTGALHCLNMKIKRILLGSFKKSHFNTFFFSKKLEWLNSASEDWNMATVLEYDRGSKEQRK